MDVIKNITTKNNNLVSGMFRIRFDEENVDEIYFYNIKEATDNIDPTRPIFEELLKTEIGKKNNKYNFSMVDKIQYIPEIKEEKHEEINIYFNNKIIYDLEIYYLTQYIPKWCEKTDENSNMIIALKNRYPLAVDYYSNLTYEWLRKNNLLNENTIICVVPSHFASEKNDSGISYVAQTIIDKCNIINGINLITRKETIEKKSTAFYKPSLRMDIDSLYIDKNVNILNKTVVILDDVTTRGNSFRAVAYHLYKKGANRVIPLAMGKTVVPNE